MRVNHYFRRQPSLGTCNKCATTVLVSVCEKETSAELVIRSQTFRYYLAVMGEQLANIAEIVSDDEAMKLNLLTAATFDCDYNDDMIITSVFRK